jgi:outer membrane lipoprotein-sorting protein
MEVKSMMMEVVIVSDGPNFWEYMPQSEQYTKKQSGPTTVTSRGTDSTDYTSDKNEYARMWAIAVGVLIPKFEDISKGLKEAHILREEALEFDGSSVNCYVIETVRDFGDAGAKSAPLRRTYWIDKGRFVVLREAHAPMRVGPDGDMAPEFTTTFTTVKINEPIADDPFVFVPPSGSTEVKDFYGKDPAGKKR